MAIDQDETYTRLALGPYPPPSLYPPPSKMQPSYAYPPPQGQPGEHYRHSPSNSNASLPPVSLPPLRSIDGQHHHPPPPPQLLPQSAGQQPGSGFPSLHSSFFGHPAPGGYGAGQPIPQYARYAAIPQGQPIAGSRGKKEIKRRTKTGCLTCRKRRIKCDELHPVCRNCTKSKRECLGYDPIFKQAAAPQTLQPAPNTSTSSASPTPSTATSGAGAYSPAQASYPPQPHSATYPPTPHHVTAPSPTTQSHPPFESPATIDPALAASPKAERKPFDHHNISLPPPHSMDSPKLKPARQLDINQLFQISQCGPYDLTGQAALDQATLSEIQNYYRKDLALGMDHLLETDWFSNTGLARLLATRELCSEVAELLQHFTQLSGTNSADSEYRCRATESRAVWHLLILCREDSGSTGGGPPSSIDLETPQGRLEVLECLLTHRLLIEPNIKALNWDQRGSRDKAEELMFWDALARFLARRSDDQIASQEMDKYLLQCRNMLNGRENRDVIYSLMVTRHLAWRVPGFPHSMHPESGGESSSVNKVYIAHKFIADEAGYRGTNHPIQRICDMAMRSFAIGW